MLHFLRYPLARRFMLFSLVILLAGMMVIGVWIGRQIERGVINRTAAVTSLYVESLLTHHLQHLSHGSPLNAETQTDIEQLFQTDGFGEQIVSIKLWALDGEILYNPQGNLMGRHFDNPDLQQSIATGEVVSFISDLDDIEDADVRRHGEQLIETYAPLKQSDGQIVAVAEFYQTPEPLLSEIRVAQRRTWAVVGIATILMFLALNGMVGQASRTILNQRTELEQNIQQLEGVLAQNRQLHERVSRAAARTTTLNEQFLRRVSSDLHDGPAQDVSLALLRLDSLIDQCGNEVDQSEFNTVRRALQSAMDEIRTISAGLRLPEISGMSATDTVRRAVRDYQRKSSTDVKIDIDRIEADVPLPVRITLYRIVQEALSNSYRHAGGVGLAVHLAADDGTLRLEVRDTGPGFDPTDQATEGHLGLAGMRERVEMLGGTFEVQSGDAGTTLTAHLPLSVSEANTPTTEKAS